MNANTRLRLWKEARALLPMWAAVAGLMLLPYFMRANNPLGITTPAYWFGCVMLGAATFGLEFQHRSMALILMQPVSRRRLWWEKMAVLAVALFALLGLYVGLWLCEDWVRFEFKHAHWSSNFHQIAKWCYAPVLAFATGPALTLVVRSLFGGAALTFLCPWALFLLGMLMWWSPMSDYPEPVGWVARFTGIIVIGGIYCGGTLLFGCRRFQNLEDIQGRGQELSLPAALMRLFAGFTDRLTLNHGSALGHLVQKEVRLHLPAFVVALGLMALWLALVVAVFVRATMDKGFLMLPIVLLCLGIPVIAGIISTAEERSLGLLDWHLTLPVSAQRQWFIKVLVAFGVNVVLGILLPGVLGQASSWIAEDKQMVAGIPGEGVPHFLIANLVIFCAALYASTAAANSMRALIGAIVLFLGGAMVLNFGDYVGRSNWHAASKVNGFFSDYGWSIGWSCLATWLYFLGLANFRRSIESLCRHVLRMAAFFAVVLVFVFTAIVFLVW